MLFGIGACTNLASFSLIQLFLLGGSIGLTILLAFRSMKWEAIIDVLHHQHDNATELQRHLTQRNRQLQNAQNGCHHDGNFTGEKPHCSRNS